MAENLDGPLIVQWARRAAKGLREKQSEINSLNVFPIPDSDTGSNMAHTMTEACESSESVDEHNTAEVTAALASGAVRGARGNSGVVLSQVLRALADTAARGPVNGAAVAAMLRQAGGFVRSAISSPVEGTVVSVLDAAARGAAAGKESLRDSVARALASAEEALENTPSQLPVLAKAGVVDAGGRGLVVILQALYDVLDTAEGVDAEGTHSSTDAGTDTGRVSGTDAGTDAPVHARSCELEVMFFFEAEPSSDAVAELREFLEDHGNSVIIGPISDSEATVHVHTRAAGPIIEKAFSLGTVTRLRIEVLPERDVDQEQLPAIPIIALTNAKGVAAVFEKAGAVSLTWNNDQEADHQALEDALSQTGSGNVAILTNGFDTSGLAATDRRLDIIDTKALVGGLAALAVHDPAAEWDDNVEEMLDAVAAQRSVSCSAEALEQTLNELLADGGELVTILWSGPDMNTQRIEEVKETFTELYPDLLIDAYQADGLGAGDTAVQIGVE
ncbi:DAK2 domain-containing protein [Corynebacterium falsenii]|uniref:DAK2 domain-containing protein n=1 Tax=Corynebacterium falsenii TaxID=108486 RepID=UPI00234D5176|nr:DAK2 domain-containing protein [Corynebacterium falsenii]MDC7103316.1 DAK2 domain-containing protein [Corynebacterium falsenii]